MKAIVFAGVSGVGKTHAREKMYPGVPFVDVADVYAELGKHTDWWGVHQALIRKAKELLKTNPLIVIEGYFLKGSPSRHNLVTALTRSGVFLEFLELRESYEVCKQRIEAQGGPRKQVRLDLLARCWEG